MTVAPTPPRPAPKSRLDALTVLRFPAALWVVLMHLQSRVPLDFPPLLRTLAFNGAYAMTLFFVLSGAVLAYGYHHLRPTVEDALVFYQARLARIYPAYLALHLLALYFATPHGTGEVLSTIYINVLTALGIQAWFPHAAMAGANAGTWSVSNEFFFYAVFPALLPLLAYLRQRWGALRVVAAICVFSGFVGLTDFLFTNTFVYYFLPFARLPEFMVGVVLGLELLSPARGFTGSRLALGLALILALVAAFTPVLGHGLWMRSNFLVVPAFAWLIFELARWDQRRPATTGSVWHLLIYFGESSYCLFLIHLLPAMYLDSPAGQAWKTRVGPDGGPALWAAFFVLSLVGAIALHEGVEKPARRFLLRRWHWHRPV